MNSTATGARGDGLMRSRDCVPIARLHIPGTLYEVLQTQIEGARFLSAPATGRLHNRDIARPLV